MKERSRIDVIYALVLLVVIMLSIVSFLQLESDSMFLGLALLIMVNIFFVSIYSFNFYELLDTQLFIRFGPLKERINYDHVVALEIVENFWSSMALSKRRIKVTYSYNNKFNTNTYISPLHLESFYKELGYRCKAAKIVTKL